MHDEVSLRQPTANEIKNVSAAIMNENSKYIKRNTLMSTLFSVLAGFAILSIDFSQITNSLFSFVLMAISIICIFMFISFKKTAKKECQIYENGSFKVIDGYVSKTSPNLETNGCLNVWFESDTYSNGWYKVRQENVEVGTKLLFVIPDVQLTKRIQCYVFTPYMLDKVDTELH